MTGLWLVSYLALWVLVAALALFLVGVLQQLGLLYRQLALQPAPAQADSIPALEQDGPAIGSTLADLELDTVNDVGKLTTTTLRQRGPTLLVFLSPMCETCQHLVGPLNTLEADAVRAARPAVLGSESASLEARDHVFPRFASSRAP